MQGGASLKKSRPRNRNGKRPPGAHVNCLSNARPCGPVIKLSSTCSASCGGAACDTPRVWPSSFRVGRMTVAMAEPSTAESQGGRGFLRAPGALKEGESEGCATEGGVPERRETENTRVTDPDNTKTRGSQKEGENQRRQDNDCRRDGQRRRRRGGERERKHQTQGPEACPALRARIRTTIGATGPYFLCATRFPAPPNAANRFPHKKQRRRRNEFSPECGL